MLEIKNRSHPPWSISCLSRTTFFKNLVEQEEHKNLVMRASIKKINLKRVRKFIINAFSKMANGLQLILNCFISQDCNWQENKQAVVMNNCVNTWPWFWSDLLLQQTNRLNQSMTVGDVVKFSGNSAEIFCLPPRSVASETVFNCCISCRDCRVAFMFINMHEMARAANNSRRKVINFLCLDLLLARTFCRFMISCWRRFHEGILLMREKVQEVKIKISLPAGIDAITIKARKKSGHNFKESLPNIIKKVVFEPS